MEREGAAQGQAGRGPGPEGGSRQLLLGRGLLPGLPGARLGGEGGERPPGGAALQGTGSAWGASAKVMPLASGAWRRGGAGERPGEAGARPGGAACWKHPEGMADSFCVSVFQSQF